MKYKRAETNLEELKKYMNDFESEIFYLTKCFEMVQLKRAKIDDSCYSIYLEQLELEKIKRDNAEFYECNFKTLLNQYKSASEGLLEVIRLFNSDQSPIDSTMIRNNRTINDILATKCSEIKHEQTPVTPMSDNILKEYLFKNIFKSQAFIIEQLVGSYSELKQKLKFINKTNSKSYSNSNYKDLVSEFRSALRKCLNVDKAMLDKYLDLVLVKYREHDELIKYLDKVN